MPIEISQLKRINVVCLVLYYVLGQSNLERQKLQLWLPRAGREAALELFKGDFSLKMWWTILCVNEPWSIQLFGQALVGVLVSVRLTLGSVGWGEHTVLSKWASYNHSKGPNRIKSWLFLKKQETPLAGSLWEIIFPCFHVGFYLVFSPLAFGLHLYHLLLRASSLSVADVRT